jgi:hypothetical protein
MRNLDFELKQLCRRNFDGSHATQRDRKRVLDLVAGQLQELGYRLLAAASKNTSKGWWRGGRRWTWP